MKNNSWKPQLSPFRKYKKIVFERVIKVAPFVFQIGEYPELRIPSKEVAVSTIKGLEFQKKIAYMKSAFKKYRKLTGYGRGITGVQLGIPERISVIVMSKHLLSSRADSLAANHVAISTKKIASPAKRDRNDNYDLLVIVNPTITKRSKKLLKYPEICMSANPIIAPVIRPSWIEFEYYDENAKKQVWNTKDDTKEGRIHNRVFQHEIDHMDGIINIDHVESKELIFESDPKFYDTADFQEIKTS